MTDRRSLLILPLAVGLCGLTEQPMPQKWLPRHPESLDPTWTLLLQTKVVTDHAKGLMTATFPESVKRLAGKPFSIEGFILPLSAGRQAMHFALTRRNTSCRFCPPSEPTESVEVMLTRPIKMTGALITVRGELGLLASSDLGMFYQLKGALVTG